MEGQSKGRPSEKGGHCNSALTWGLVLTPPLRSHLIRLGPLRLIRGHVPPRAGEPRVKQLEFADHTKFYRLILDTPSHLTLNSSLYKTFPCCKGKHQEKERIFPHGAQRVREVTAPYSMKKTQHSPRLSVRTTVTLTATRGVPSMRWLFS